MAMTEKSLFSFKKCSDSHKKPIISKCDRIKAKKEKQDTSHEHVAKKTPRSKSFSEHSGQDKMLELVMQTMSGFSEKLTAMEAQISDLSSGTDMVIGETANSKRQSHSREKTKITELFQCKDNKT